MSAPELQQLIDQVEQLWRLLTDERQALTRNDLDAIRSTTQRKDEAVAKIARVELAPLLHGDVPPTIKELQTKLRARLNECHALNQLNGKLVQHARATVRTVLQAATGTDAAPTYNPRGLSGGSVSRPLGNA